jgi:hypothetical protein
MPTPNAATAAVVMRSIFIGLIHGFFCDAIYPGTFSKPDYCLNGNGSPKVHTDRASPFTSTRTTCVLALLAEFLRGIDREKHRFPLGLVRAVFLAIKFYKPDILMAHNQIAGIRTTRKKH